jgi:hypothetical protein
MSVGDPCASKMSTENANTLSIDAGGGGSPRVIELVFDACRIIPTNKAHVLLNGNINRMFWHQKRTSTPTGTLTLLAATRIMHALSGKHS